MIVGEKMYIIMAREMMIDSDLVNLYLGKKICLEFVQLLIGV